MDANGDGIGDTPYVIDINNQDRYPLMQPRITALLTDLNMDGRVNIQDITMVAVAFGSRPEDPNWNFLADLDNNQAINIIDIARVAMDFGITY
jgi:endoglucanase